jgi:hypothetical protein
MKLWALETFRNQLWASRRSLRTSDVDASIIAARAHLAVHYIARAKGLHSHALCNCRPYPSVFAVGIGFVSPARAERLIEAADRGEGRKDIKLVADYLRRRL